MPDLTVSANVDTMLQAANFAAVRTALSLTTLATTTPGTGVATALAVNVGSAGAFVTFNGALGTPSSGTVTNLTGTASININGTVGATTPAAGTFTDLTASGTTTLGAITDLGTPGAGVLTNCTGLPVSSLVAGILAGNITLGESAGQIVLDPTLSADGTWSGIMQAGTAGATLAFGDLIYLAAADSRWELADADAASTSGDVILGMCVLAAAADGDPTNVLLYGKIRADAAFPALTVGAPAYVGTSAGDIQTAQPSGTDDVIRIVGHALTADVLLFNPDGFYITHV